MRKGLAILSLFIVGYANAQEDYISLNKAIKQPAKTTRLLVNANTDSLALLAKNINRFRHLEAVLLKNKFSKNESDIVFDALKKSKMSSLSLTHNEFDFVPEQIGELDYLTSLSVKGSEELDYRKLFSKLTELPKLKRLELIENGLLELPKQISKIVPLQSIYIEGNENINFIKAIKYLSKLEELKELKLPINQITDIPSNIGLLEKLEVLDITNNILTDLHKNIGALSGLDSLNIEGNIIIDPVNELKQVKGLNIKFLTLDGGLSDDEKFQLHKLFPEAVIKEVSAGQEAIAERPVVEPSSGENVIKIRRTNGVRILSNAYLHYAQIFNSRYFESNFDLTLFEERYQSLNYENVRRRQPNTEYKNMALELFKKGQKGEVWFDFRKRSKKNIRYGEYLYRNNPELNVCIGMKWVLIDDITTKEFKSMYIKDRHYTDIRIHYKPTGL